VNQLVSFRIRERQPRLRSARTLTITQAVRPRRANAYASRPPVTVVTPRPEAIRSYTAQRSAHRSTICARIASFGEPAPAGRANQLFMLLIPLRISTFVGPNALGRSPRDSKFNQAVITAASRSNQRGYRAHISTNVNGGTAGSIQ
jgi:hypothetical protein